MWKSKTNDHSYKVCCLKCSKAEQSVKKLSVIGGTLSVCFFCDM